MTPEEPVADTGRAAGARSGAVYNFDEQAPTGRRRFGAPDMAPMLRAGDSSERVVVVRFPGGRTARFIVDMDDALAARQDLAVAHANLVRRFATDAVREAATGSSRVPLAAECAELVRQWNTDTVPSAEGAR